MIVVKETLFNPLKQGVEVKIAALAETQKMTQFCESSNSPALPVPAKWASLLSRIPTDAASLGYCLRMFLGEGRM